MLICHVVVICQTASFADEFIYYPDFQTRENYSALNNPPKYSAVTLLADGTHCLINYSPYEADKLHPDDDFSKPNYISHKLKQPALNTQVLVSLLLFDFKQLVMTTDGYICAVSTSSPAGTYNDPRQMNEGVNDLLGVCWDHCSFQVKADQPLHQF